MLWKSVESKSHRVKVGKSPGMGNLLRVPRIAAVSTCCVCGSRVGRNSIMFTLCRMWVYRRCKLYSEVQKYYSTRGYSQESLHHVFQSKPLEFSRYGSDNDKRRRQVFKFFSIKINTGYVSSIRTRNSTRDNIIYKCYK